MIPGLLSVILTLVVIGVLLWLINTYIPMASGIKSLINGVVLVSPSCGCCASSVLRCHSGDR